MKIIKRPKGQLVMALGADWGGTVTKGEDCILPDGKIGTYDGTKCVPKEPSFFDKLLSGATAAVGGAITGAAQSQALATQQQAFLAQQQANAKRTQTLVIAGLIGVGVILLVSRTRD